MSKIFEIYQNYKTGKVANLAWSKLYSNHYISMIQNETFGKQSIAIQSLSIICLTPSFAFKELQDLKIRCAILSSGTLTPMDAYEQEFDIKFPVKLTTSHVIDAKN